MKLLDESETLAFAAKISAFLKPGLVIFLRGDLGCGKTCFVRGLLSAKGVQGAVKSPTYTLVEAYQIEGIAVYHFDLYRLSDPEELEWMGFRDYFRPDSICLIEWPERGSGFLPKADAELVFEMDGFSRKLELRALSEKGQALLAHAV